MNINLLNNILKDKKKWLDINKIDRPLNSFKHLVISTKKNFYNALSKKNKVFILECKKASPSCGEIIKNFNIIDIVNEYKKYASAISVLTDEKYFQGSFNFIKIVSNNINLPILCKDFIIDPWQIYFARLHNADAILLILSILKDNTWNKLSDIAHDLNMGVLTEVSNYEECIRANKLGAKVVGINNRNLIDMSIDLRRTVDLSQNLLPNSIIISESGINSYKDIRYLSKYVNGFLIGTTFMKAKNINLKLKKIILGHNKICGLTRTIDAKFSYKAGAVYGGLIFIKSSNRYIDLLKAKNIISSIPLLYVGVFKNERIEIIVKFANELNLTAVQLHGLEDQDYVNRLYKKLNNKCYIWKAFNFNNKFNVINNMNFINKYILDSGGGTGKTFNWTKINKFNLDLNKSILAGGLSASNCLEAMSNKCIGLDFNSGVEDTPGIKNFKKIFTVFNILKFGY